MNQKALLVVPLLLLCAAGAWLFVGGGDLPLPDATDGEPSAASAPAATSSNSALAVEASAAADAGAGAEAGTRDAVASHVPLVPIPDDAKWTEVRIVDKETEEPVPDAIVAWFDDETTKRLQEEPRLLGDDRSAWQDAEQLAMRFGWHTTSDARGIARVHQANSTQVIARHGDRYGWLQLGKDLVAPRDGHKLKIAPDLSLPIRVVQADGEPAFDVPVAIAVHDAQGRFQHVWNWGPMATTRAPDGIARIPHLQSHFRDEERPQNQSYRARTLLPGHADPGVEFAPQSPPKEPIELRLPPCGSVKARIDVPGQVFDEKTRVMLYENSRNREWMSSRANLERRLDADGWARFPHVPLGKDLQAWAAVLGGNVGKQFAGPMAAGAEVEVVLTTTDDQILVTGRLLDSDRAPIADQTFLFRMSGQQMGTEANLRTDAGGRFLAVVGRSRKNNQADSISAEVRRPGQRPVVARAPGRELRAGREDLGDLVAELDPLLVGGRYVLDGKAPGKWRANVRVERYEGVQQGRGTGWRRVQELLSHQDDDGNFDYRGRFTPGRFRLVFTSWQHLPIEPIEFTAGTKDLVIEVSEGAPLAATMLLPKGSREEIVAQLVPEDGAPQPPAGGQGNQQNRLRTTAWSRDDDRAQASWRALTPGRYRLEIRLAPVPQPLHEVAGITVPTVPEGDPRLIDIDLRDRLRLQTIRLFDQNGKPLQEYDGGFFPTGQDPAKELVGFPCHGAETQLTLPNGLTDLWVAVAGYQPRDIRCTGAPLDVRLDPWPTVELQFPGLAMPDGLALLAALAPPKGPSRQYRSSWNSGDLSELTTPRTHERKVVGGRIVLPIGEGLHELTLQVAGQNQESKVEMPPVQVLSTAGSVVVQVPPDALARAVERVQAQIKAQAKGRQK